MAREFTKVGVVGLGTMGAGIDEVFARGGIERRGGGGLRGRAGAGQGHAATPPIGRCPVASSPRPTGTRCWPGSPSRSAWTRW